MSEMVVFNEQGLNAMRHGKILPYALEQLFEMLGIPVMSYWEYRYAVEEPAAAAVKDVPFTTIYGCKGTTDFVLYDHARGLRIRFWCKWQETSGTVDEKLPYLCGNIKQFPENEVVFVVGGAGWRDGAMGWFTKNAKRGARRADGRKQKVLVLTIDKVVEYLLALYGREDEIQDVIPKLKSLMRENHQMLDGQLSLEECLD